ncbi:MAG: PIG-L family deacetylase [Actinomycetota bacterium]
MATLVCFHAHPDDEALSTGGLMAKAAAAGHRVVLVTATRGEQGEPQPGVLADGEELWQRRVIETAESAEVLGAEEPRFLDYEDSGMMGEPTNDNPACFWQADLDEAADRLAVILTEVSADVLTIYDDHGLYGHPDHIQVHRVGLLAAERAGVANVYEATVSRDRMLESFDQMPDDVPEEERPNPEDFGEFGVPHDDLAFSVDIGDHLGAKRKAMAVHRSQISDQSFFLTMPEDRFATMFSTEWYAVPGRTATGGPEPVDLLPGLDR